MLILKELLFKPFSRFSRLNIKGLTSDHFSYHIKTLIDEGYVKKEKGVYSLTAKGKEFASTMDTDNATIEKQPKVGVLVVTYKYRAGKKYLLIQERTKEPYFGYKGFFTGKVRFGEKVCDTARRELTEETGLTAQDVTLKTVIRDQVINSEKGNLLEDKIFFICTIKNPKGEIISTENGKNYWITEEDFYKLDKKYYNEDIIYELSKKKRNVDFLEAVYAVDEF